VLPILLGLGGAACIGIGDFAAGIASRRISPAQVGFWTQLFGVATAAVLLLLLRPSPAEGQIPWALLGGLATGTGLALLYRAMAVGAISLVAPIAACSVVFPVVYSVAKGEELTPLAAAGIVAIIVGIVLASLQPTPVLGDPTDTGGAGNRRAILLAVASTVAFGLFFILIDVAPQVGTWGSLWTGAGARLSSFGLQSALLLLSSRRLPAPGRALPWLASAGILDQVSLVLLGLGAMTDSYGIVTALLGLYPVFTALLGTIFLHERLTRLQTTGATLALIGVMLVSL
jgi:drug/metabolite transporter (DMT)-like permease